MDSLSVLAFWPFVLRGVARATMDAAGFFGELSVKAVVTPLVLLAIGLLLFWKVKGTGALHDEIQSWALLTLAPTILFLAALLVWHGFRAPYLIYTEEQQKAAARFSELEKVNVGLEGELKTLRMKPVVGPSTSSKAVPVVASPDTWLQVVAKADDANIGNRIIRQSVEAQGNNLGAVEPFIEIRITMTNASVFAIQCVRLEGRVMFGGQPLQAQPQLISQGMNLSHASTKTVVIRQYLQPETVARIRQNKEQLSAGQTALWLEYEFQGQVKGFRVGGPNAMDFTGF